MSTVLEQPRAKPHARSATEGPRVSVADAVHRAMPWLVLALATGIGLSLYASFWADSRHLWYIVVHDRSAHYEFGLNLAMDLRRGDLGAMLHHLDGVRVWGPLHGIVLGAVQLICGPDYRLGILPSWSAWIATVVLAFLLGRRLLPAGGTAAGLLAALAVLQSPAHKAFATDIMLESMGAAFTLLCLLRYLIAVQDGEPAKFRWLGLSLTLLFLTKSNYWLLVAVSLVAGECVRHPAEAFASLRAAGRFLGSREWRTNQLRSPLNYVVLALLGLAIAIIAGGGTVLELGKFRVSLTSGHNLVHFAYVIVLLRAVLWWRRDCIGAALADRHPAWRAIADWHLWPVALYFALPKRLGSFLWFISPANSDQSPRPGGIVEGARHYAQALLDDYHVFGWIAAATLAGALLGLATFKRWRLGAFTIFGFVFLIALATCRHPMLKYRFIHSWAAVLWVLAAAGLIHAVYSCIQNPSLRRSLAAAICVGFAAVLGPYWLQPGHAQEGGVRTDAPCVLDLADRYLPELANARRPTLLSSVHAPSLLSWTYQEATRRSDFATEIKGLDPAAPDPRTLIAWADKTKSDTVVLIEIDPASVYYIDVVANLDVAACRRFFEQHPERFALTHEWTSPHKVRTTIWTVLPSPSDVRADRIGK